jgi:YesN/AraC family two-component response regulator
MFHGFLLWCRAPRVGASRGGDDHLDRRTTGVLVVGEAADGADGVGAAIDLEPDVVLLEVMLPDLDGFSIATR